MNFDGRAQFITLSGLSFALIGLGVLLLVMFHIYTIVIITKHFRYSIRKEKARREIEARDRRNLARMIRAKASEEEWNRFLAGLDREDNN